MQKHKNNILSKFFVYLIFVFGFWFFVFNLSSAAPLDNIPTNSWIYDAIDYLKVSGYIKSIPPSSKPWTKQEVINLLNSSSINRTYANSQTAFYIDRLLIEFSDDLLMGLKTSKNKPPIKIDYGQGDIFVNAYARFTHSKLPYWLTPYGNNMFPDNQTGSLGIIFNLDQNSKISLYHYTEFTYFYNKIYDSDSTDTHIRHVPGTRLTESFQYLSLQSHFRFDTKEAYIAFPIYFLTVEIGRDYLYLGPGYRSSVLLSDIAPSFDQIQLRATGKSYKALWFCSALSPWYDKHRFLTGQRLEFNLGKYIKIGGTMLTAFSFDSLQTKGFWGYINPLIPNFVELHDSGHDDNLLMGFDFVTYIRQCKIYGQLMVDNFEFNKRHNRPPNTYSLAFGAYLPYKQFAMRGEYSKITRFTYYHRILHIAYTSYSVPLGHSLGQDADELFLRFEYYPIDKLRLNLVSSLTQRGAGNHGNLADRTWDDGEPRPTTFPSSPIEKLTLVGPEFYYQPRFDLIIQGGIYYNSDNKINSFLKIEYRL